MLLTILPNLGFAASLVITAPVSGADTYGVHYGKSVSTGHQLHDSMTRGVGSFGITGKEVIR